MADLERRFRTLSRESHPDYFFNASAADRRASLERTSRLNDAYRTLKNPATRVLHLLELEGMPAATPQGGGSRQGRSDVPPALLEDVFALNEQLEAVRELREAGASPERWAAQLAAARRPVEQKRAEHERRLQELSTRWDAALDSPAATGKERRRMLEDLREVVLERNYIGNLLATIERYEGSGP